MKLRLFRERRLQPFHLLREPVASRKPFIPQEASVPTGGADTRGSSGLKGD